MTTGDTAAQRNRTARRAAASLSARLGMTGLNVLQRVMGLVVSAFAVEFILTGLCQSFPGLG